LGCGKDGDPERGSSETATWLSSLMSSSPLANQLGVLVGAILRESEFREIVFVQSHGISQLRFLLTSYNFWGVSLGESVGVVRAGEPDVGES